MNRKSILAVVAAVALGGTSAYAQQDRQWTGGQQQFGAQQGQQWTGQQQFDRQRDQQQFGQMGQQRGQMGQQQFRGQDRQQFGQMGQQQRGLTDQTRDALRQAGFTRIREIGPDRIQARGPDGQRIMIQTQAGDQVGRTGSLGQQQPGQQQFGMQWDQQRFGQQPGQRQFGMQRDQQQFGQPRQTAILDEDRIRTILEQRGMTDIEDLERDARHFRATADWYGEEVDVVVDARTGVILEPREMERSQVRAKLQEEGWEEVEVERDGPGFQAIAERDGTEYRLHIDAFSGFIVAQEERS